MGESLRLACFLCWEMLNFGWREVDLRRQCKALVAPIAFSFAFEVVSVSSLQVPTLQFNHLENSQNLATLTLHHQ